MLFVLKIILLVSCGFGLCWGATIDERGECVDPPQVRRVDVRANGTRAWRGSWPDCGRRKFLTPPKRISGGFTAQPGEYPAYVRLDIYTADKLLTCGGTLISDRQVLTAAHCVRGHEINRIRVVTTIYGNDLTPSLTYEVSTFCVDPNYDAEFLNHDIAILQLKRRVALSDNVQPACLPSEPPDYSIQFRAVGLGDTDGTGRKADQLQVLPMYWDHRCIYVHDADHPSKMCFLPYEGTAHVGNTCSGDSGGPLLAMKNGRLTVYGVTSYGPLNSPCKRGVPGRQVSANVYNLRHSIEYLIKECERYA